MSSPSSTLRSNRAGSENKHENKERSHSVGPQGPAPSDSELMSSMMRRLTAMEQKVKSQQRAIDNKAKRIAELEKKLLEAQLEKQNNLVKTCRKLQKQVYEMERFLNDYGMIWVGSGEDSDSEDEEVQPGSSEQMWEPEASLAERFCMNFDLVLQNIQHLNIMAGEGESHITAIPGGAKLSRQPCVPLWLYKNGIVMFNGPFRSYHDPSTKQCMQDLMDGYFPSELKERFPDGLVFEVSDRREKEFVVVRLGDRFPGRGQAVGGSEEMVGISKESYDMLPDLSQSHLPGRKLSVEQFVSKLPKSVVKEGKVIDIRSSIKARLQGSAEGAGSCLADIIETPALQTLRERVESGAAGGSASDPEVTTLRVKSEDGEKTFILKMFFSETIGQLRHYLDAHRASCRPPYDIISLFPQRCHSNDNQTLQECGLTPNAALLLRPHPPLKST